MSTAYRTTQEHRIPNYQSSNLTLASLLYVDDRLSYMLVQRTLPHPLVPPLTLHSTYF